MPRRPERQPTWVRAFATIGGLIFVASLIYGAVSYAGRFGVAISWAAFDDPLVPIAANTALFTVFALHHSIFARTGLKTWIARVAPAALERSIYVWIASLLFLVTVAGWQTVPGVLWQAHGGLAGLCVGLQLTGVLFTLVAARGLDVLHLSGIRQVLAAPTRDDPPRLDEHGPYGLVRHPIYLAWLLMVWPAAMMTGTRCEFAIVSSVYLVAAIPFEERDLHRTFGDAYAAYCRRVRWKMVPFIY